MKYGSGKKFSKIKFLFVFVKKIFIDNKIVELKSGDAIFFNGYLLHRSLKNVTSNKLRLSFANHYCSAESLLPWNYDGRLEGYVEDSRDIVMCCGKDPYQWKGTENLHTTKPFMRGTQQYKEPSL